jgi:hypothetical protein
MSVEGMLSDGGTGSLEHQFEQGIGGAHPQTAYGGGSEICRFFAKPTPAPTTT